MRSTRMMTLPLLIAGCGSDTQTRDLLNDVGKDGVLSDIKSWIYKHLAA